MVMPSQALSLTITDVEHEFALKGETLKVLDGVSLDIRAGEFVALLGPSGCGKSTLLRMVAGLDAPCSGTITADGQDIIGRPDPSRVVVFQDPTLFPWLTVWKNVALGPYIRKQKAEQAVNAAIELVGLKGFEQAYPHQLSGGMAQRAALARALVNDPKLLVLDEPLGKLDSLTRLVMQSELMKLWQARGFTALMVTHDIEEALLLATRVVVMGPRPTRVLAERTVDLPFPRHRDNEQLIALRKDIIELLGLTSEW